MSNFYFNLFASIIIISVFMTISVNNAVYAVLFLILAFFSSMCILFLLNVDYLALMFILIYVGAITILFLSVQAREMALSYLKPFVVLIPPRSLE